MGRLRSCLMIGMCCSGGACATLSGGDVAAGDAIAQGEHESWRGHSDGTKAASGAGNGEGPSAREWNQLNERVRFLERRLSDMDIKIALMSERLEAQGGAGAPRRAQAPSTGQVSRPESVELLPLPETATAFAEPMPVSDAASELIAAPEPMLAVAPSEEDPESLLTGPDPDATAAVLKVPTADPHVAVHGVADVKAAYQWAQRQRETGNWREAERVFSEIYVKFPKHSLGDNALYWTGVVQAAGGDPRRAIETFAQVPVRYPRSPKIPDALFGMASAHESLGEPLLAEVLYSQLVEEYPKAEKRADAKRALVRLTHPNP